MKVAYYSLGCKVNLYESQSVINQFLDAGFELVNFNDVSDVYIINTCSITHVSDAKSRKIIREAIKRNSNAIIAVMGCYSQLRPQDIKDINGVDVVVGTTNRSKLFEIVMSKINNKNNVLDDSFYTDVLKAKEYEELKLNKYNNKTRGFVKVQEGCDNYCSYCTVPYARGHIRSRKIENCVDEITRLTNLGMKEIILSGINTGAYGKDFGKTLSDLLKEIFKIPNLGRIRISSIEESEITKDLLDVIKENEEHFCMHFHIPLQGACNNTLKRMNRKYNTEEYKKKIDLIRSYFKDVNITTDILAGFSGETEEDFNDSLKFIASIKYGEMHVFPYSRRPLTKAYDFKDVVDEITKRKRVNELLSLNNMLALEYRNQFKNKIVEVLVEKNVNSKCFGHSSNYLEVEFIDDTAKENDIILVEIIEINYPICKGRRIK